MTGYDLSRSFWDFAFENPDKVKPTHISIYFFAIEHCNRFGWKEKFKLPASMVLEAIGIKSYSVYKKAFDELADWGFIQVIEYSKNQYSANIIALKENSKASNKALDKALIKHASKHSESTLESTVSVIKQITINQEQGNNTSPENEIDLELENLKKETAEFICSFFNVSQITNSNLWMKIHDFIEIVSKQNLITHFVNQFNFYKLYHEIEENKKFKHSPINFIGNLPDKSDGAWNSRDWEETYNNSKNGTKKNFAPHDTGKSKSYHDTIFVV